MGDLLSRSAQGSGKSTPTKELDEQPQAKPRQLWMASILRGSSGLDY